MFSVQIYQIDYVLSPPGPLDRSHYPRVPILRIFGQSSVGLRTCLHVHQVYPYCYIEYQGDLDLRHVKQYVRKFKKSLNHAIALSLKRDPNSTKSQYVCAVVLVKGVKFYGFHSQYSPFLKIILLDPRLMNRVATILQSGSFMCDFGLYGCGSVGISKAYRRAVLGSETDILPEQVTSFEPSPYPPQSHMPIELDVISPEITNRTQIKERCLHHRLVIPGPERPSEPIVTSIRELWEEERVRRRALGMEPSPELPQDPSEGSRETGSGWIAEARWWDEIHSRLERERPVNQSHSSSTPPWESQVMSIFESTEALWESSYRRWKPDKQTMYETSKRDGAVLNESDLSAIEEVVEGGEVDVNEDLLAYRTIDDLGDMEEDEVYNEGRDPTDGDLDEDNAEVKEIEEESDDEDTSENRGASRSSSPNPFLDDGTTKCSRLFSSSQAQSAEIQENDKQKKAQLQEQRSTPTFLSSDHKESLQSIPLASTIRISCSQLTKAYNLCRRGSQNSYAYYKQAPGAAEITTSFESLGLPSKIYKPPFYSNEDDAPEQPKEFSGLVYHLRGEGTSLLEGFAFPFTGMAGEHDKDKLLFHACTGWEYASLPPSRKVIKNWLQHQGHLKQEMSTKMPHSQIDGPTQFNIYGFKGSPIAHVYATSRSKQSMTILSVEVMAPTHGKNVPNPESDPICIAVYGFQVAGTDDVHTGVIAIQNIQLNPRRIRDFHLEIVDTELDLLNRLSDIVAELDPDILTGWEVQQASWGYLWLRAKHYDFDFQDFLSRAPPLKAGSNDRWDGQTTSNIKVAGRHVLNVWRIMRSELALTSYTLSNVAFHVMRQRVPFYSFATLSRWYDSTGPSHMVALMHYLIQRNCTTLQILEATELVTKTAEFARIFGVDFHSVISRGSQFKVESFMFRIAKSENFVLLSPSKSDVGLQNAAECMPLIMEPMSAFYTSPLVVLDFQSLYPSVMIAYNYCYSTCLGRIKPFQGNYKFGVTNLDLGPGILDALQEHITVAPNGIMYVKSNVRKGLLGRMLVELLNTRVMVKQALKSAKSDKALARVLHARQLALKYIANVTYGYTSATYSGRMPAVEIADSIVQTGRETLEKAINFINGSGKWGAKVVYGDTDSLFVYLPGKTREQAFRIGNEMADAVTRQNPVPIKLKFEKVYLPCVLMAKKRYVGFKYENPDETEPEFDAKGIETVRRDGVLAQRKLVENSLKILFRTQDLSQVKDYCCRSWYQIMENKVPIQDFIFAKEVRMGTYSEKGPPPPGAVVAARRMVLDPNDEPQYGDRIPYIISRGEPGALLAERALDPLEMINDPRLQLDALYYITRVLIPPLERVFNLVGADVRHWFAEMPKISNTVSELALASPGRRRKVEDSDREESPSSPGRRDLEEHLENNQCLVCGEVSFTELCEECIFLPQTSLTILGAKTGRREERMLTTHKVCVTCTSIAPSEPVECECLDCPWFYARKRAEHKLDMIETMDILIDEFDSKLSRSPTASPNSASDSNLTRM
ncbi:hypothetical protein Agabi119p4_489 [Agaricus bisporus var. burnettii]|uniref:DNA polymerase n=1 Tax=Agaricus bisporus var. burnettii TaxID=192524 RepID=A0A8H7FAU2_AGABI|nr:hypothetical protein Agabi119p4_489 [Agaricus bisporus var. burnettii]